METRAGLDAMTLLEMEVSSFASQSVKVRTDTSHWLLRDDSK
jgi:hypothetical protein